MKNNSFSVPVCVFVSSILFWFPQSTGADPGGGGGGGVAHLARPPPPPKIWKNMIFFA